MSSSPILWLLVRAVPIVVALSFVIFTYERELVPLYGSGPTNFLLNKIGFVSALLSSIQPFRVNRSYSLLLAAIALTAAPNATYWVGVWSSRRGDPLLGPAIAHVAVLAPVVFLLTGVLGWPTVCYFISFQIHYISTDIFWLAYSQCQPSDSHCNSRRCLHPVIYPVQTCMGALFNLLRHFR